MTIVTDQSQLIRALSSACADARLYSLPIKIGTRRTSACDAQIMLVCWTHLWHIKLAADTLTVCAFFVTHTKTAARTKLRRLYVPRSEDFSSLPRSINIFPVENRPAHKYLCWVFPWCIRFISKTTTIHVKSHWQFAQMGFSPNNFGLLNFA